MSLVTPVTRDGFAYAAGDLLAYASNNNTHRRATVFEIQDHFKNGSDKDHPAHWFEAQLLHYGLPSSKTKPVARMRLFDAMNAGNLIVPAHIQKLEGELKKEWLKNERDAKKALKTQSTPKPATTTSAPAKKRKADASNVDLTLNVGGISILLSANSATTSSAPTAAAKKPKISPASTASSKPATKTKAEPTPKAVKEKAAPKPKASSATVKKETLKPTATSKAKSKPISTTGKTTKATAPKASAASSVINSSTPTPAKKQTARSFRGGLSQAPSSRPATTTTTSSAEQRAPRTLQTARRSGAFVARGGRASVAASRDHDDHYSGGYNGGYDDGYDGYESHNSHNSYDDDGHDSYDERKSFIKAEEDDVLPPPYSQSSQSIQPLGLLNGRYNIVSQEVTSQWDYQSHSFSLTLTLDGKSLWGKFDLGIVQGVLYFPKRPWESSADETVPFIWRGQETDSTILYGDHNKGWMKFHGGGLIEAGLDWMGIDFGGTRVDGQGTRSQVNVFEMKRLWESYSEDEYERLNRARWR